MIQHNALHSKIETYVNIQKHLVRTYMFKICKLIVRLARPRIALMESCDAWIHDSEA
jgi:hypothetical protein